MGGRVVDSDRLAGILMCVGGISGLAGMAPLLFSGLSIFSILATAPFGLLALLGVYVHRKHPMGRALAGAALGLAALGGGISALYLFGALLFQSGLGTIQGSVAVLAGMVALAGAAIKRIPTTRQTSAFP